jgi:hypothetical protein
MIESFGCMWPNKQFAIISHTENRAEYCDRLLKDLATMSHKKQTNLALMFLEEPLEVESGNHRLASACRRYDEVAGLLVHVSFCFQSVQDSFLERVRAQVEEDGRANVMRPSVPDSVAQNLRCIGVVWNEQVAVPVRFEFCGELVEYVRKVLSGDLLDSIPSH